MLTAYMIRQEQKSSGADEYPEHTKECHEREGNCPRCGSLIWDMSDEGTFICPICGLDDESPDGLVPDEDCCCYEIY